MSVNGRNDMIDYSESCCQLIPVGKDGFFGVAITFGIKCQSNHKWFTNKNRRRQKCQLHYSISQCRDYILDTCFLILSISRRHSRWDTLILSAMILTSDRISCQNYSLHPILRMFFYCFFWDQCSSEANHTS